MITFKFNGNVTVAPSPRGTRCEELRKEIAAHTGLSIRTDPDVDYEDWTEASAQLREVLKAGVETELLWRSERLIIRGEACAPAFMGALGSKEMLHAEMAGAVWPIPDNSKAERYAETTAFMRFAGRKILVCDMPGEWSGKGDVPPADLSLEDALRSFAGIKTIVKQVLPIKQMGLRFLGKLREGEEKADAKRVFAADPYHVVLFEGQERALLVQEEIPMRFETRYFVVDGEPVSGAGCIENHTPLDRDPMHVDGVTHAVFEETRNGGNIIHDSAIAQKLEAFVREVATAMLNESPKVRHLVIDVALGQNDQPIMIEANPYQNSGLYANDPEAVFAPLLDLIRKPEPSPEP